MLEREELVTSEEIIDETTATVEINEEAELAEEIVIQDTEMDKLKKRTAQLFELIAFDPANTQIYRNEIIELNIRLVSHVLKKYRPYGDDEFQLGCIGLIIATNTYDPSRGVPYPNYACFCIARELHKAHRDRQHMFEGIVGNALISLDECAISEDGDSYSKHENIPDVITEAEFEKLISDFSLDTLFDRIIMPSIEGIASNTKGQEATVDFEKWKALELQYLLEMAEIDSQKARLSLSAMSKALNVSTQNIRMRHKRVIHKIRQRCIAIGYNI